MTAPPGPDGGQDGRPDDADAAAFAARHARRGWQSLAVWLALGLALEGLHGLKVAWYVDPAHATRRLLWTLAHAHGTLGGLLHLALAANAARLTGRARDVAGLGLTAGGVLLPVGFLLGGALPWGGDPGLGVALVPLGAVAWLVGVTAAARGSR